jgi:heavy metal sensor kinase
MKFNSLAYRLTFWYAGVFSFCFLAVFGAFYIVLQDNFHRWTDSELKKEVVEVSVAYSENGFTGIAQQFRQEHEASGNGGYLGRVLNSHGTILFEIAPGDLSRIPIIQQNVEKAVRGDQVLQIVEPGDNQVINVIYSPIPDGNVVQIGLELLEHEIWLRRFSKNLLKFALLALAASVIAGGLIARGTLKPIHIMARTASSITGPSMGRRMQISGRGDEVDQLAEAFNGTLERIDTLVEGIRDVTENLAHDLRTPITGIRGMAEVTLSLERHPEDYREALSRIIEQLDRVLSLSDAIFDVIEAENGTLMMHRENVPLDALANEIIQTFEPVASDRGIKFETSIAEGISTIGDRGRLRQALANLIDNALKYTSSGGCIKFCVGQDSKSREVLISVSDNGSGISDKDLPHVFERYYRGDKSRSGPGVGLGLPLVQGIIKSHDGRVTVESRPGTGSTFRVFLPGCDREQSE